MGNLVSDAKGGPYQGHQGTRQVALDGLRGSKLDAPFASPFENCEQNIDYESSCTVMAKR
jgi:hypothetical protein